MTATMADRPVLTEQDYYTRTVNYLRRQTMAMGVDSFGDVRCSYLTPNGCKCAVGYWMPDGDEAVDSEGGAHTLPDRLAGIAWPDTRRGRSLATRLQELHDTEHHRGPLYHGLSARGEYFAQSIAVNYGLVYEPPLNPPLI